MSSAQSVTAATVPRRGAPRPAPRAGRRALLVAGVIAAVIVVLALDEAGASVASRSVTAILVWWTVLVAVAVAPARRTPLPRAGLAAPALLLALAVFAGLSSAWAPSAERAVLEMDRLLLHAGFVLLPVVLAARAQAGTWADGLALAIGLVGLLALGSRLLPDLLPGGEVSALLPTAATRLSEPLGYWNGLGILLGLGVPLLLRTAVSARRAPWRVASVAALAPLATAVYLTSSRGGVAVALVGGVLFVALAGERLHALLAAVVGALGAVGAIAIVASHGVLVDGPFDTPAVVTEGREAALLVLVVAVAAGLVHALLTARAPANLRLRWLAAPAAVLVLVGLALGDPAGALREFRAPPPTGAGSFEVGSHLASGAGSGRWQFWEAAVEQFEEHPVRGGGAGSYEPWWAANGTIDWFVRNAHSLWLETLGELGLLGALLLVAAFAVALGAGVTRWRRTADRERTTLAALLAVLIAFALGAAIDWIWQLPVVAAVGLLAVGLLARLGTDPAEPSRTAAPGPGPAGRRRAVRVAIALAVLVAVVAQAVPLLADRELAASRSAVARDDLAVALERARRAEAIQPWASSPRLQQALVHERTGRLDLARADAAAAIERDRGDWRLEVVAARLAAKDGDVAAARRALARARNLNPRSTLIPAAGTG